MAKRQQEFDEIGYWSEVKLDIVREYAAAYSRILASQDKPKLAHYYIDGFAGAGVHVSKQTGEFIPGSPLNALNITPPFNRYYFVDLNEHRVDQIRALVPDRDDVVLLQGDCNRVLIDQVFPEVKWDEYRRALCLLDPYGMHLDWAVLETAGKSRAIDIFLNFPIMDINMNALRKKGGTEEGKRRLTAFWGDTSWEKIAYAQHGDLFGEASQEKITTNTAFVEAFRTRLKKVAGFKHVLPPMAMRNEEGLTVYYLFFASQKDVAHDVAKAIFKKHAARKH